jgi:hypothetical protein
MSVPYYYIHAGARLRRILRQKEIVILHYAKKAGLTPQGLYRYFSQSIIKKEKLEVLLDAVPMTFRDFLHWDSLDEDSLHQGELLLLYLAQHKIKVKQLADQLQLPVHEMYDWFDSTCLSEAQQERLYTELALAPAYFTDPRAGKPAVNWEQAYLDKCMEVLQYVRKVNALEKKISTR